MKDFINQHFKWFGQFSLQIEFGGAIIFLDPYNLPDDYSVKADYVLISHGHFDHLAFDDLKKVASPATPIFGPEKEVIPKLEENGYTNLHKVKPGDKLNLGGIDIELYPAYNIRKTQYHPRENNWVAYLFNLDGKRIYISSDTERIPEMKEVKADVTFMTLGQVYTMDSVDEAVQAVLDTGAKLAIPAHYGMYEGSQEDADKFCKELEKKGIETMCLEKLGKE